MMLLVPILLFVSTVTAIWPIPLTYTNGSSVLWLAPNASVTLNGTLVNTTWDGAGSAYFPGFTSTADLSENVVISSIKRTLKTMLTERFVPGKLHKSGALDFEPSLNTTIPKVMLSHVDITVSQADDEHSFRPRDGEVDETYYINVTTNGYATINAKSAIGVVRAMDTFTQLFFTHSKSPSLVYRGLADFMPAQYYEAAVVYTNLVPVQIMDKPRFSHRGLNLDVARNFFPVTDILRTIDAMAWTKFSRLHIHATDSQSWPLESQSFPKITTYGPYGPDMVYRNSDIKTIQQYGQYRGVEVYFEIDMPGHTASLAKVYPSVISCYDMPDWQTYASEPPSGQLKLNDTGVSYLLEYLFKEILPQFYPYSAYFHLGGDEINANCYNLDPGVRTNDTMVIKPLLQDFVDRNLRQVATQNMTPIVWEELLLDWNLKLPEEVVIQTWRNDSSVKSVAANGHKVIVGNYMYWYLDCGRGQWLNFEGSEAETYWPYADYCSPMKSWRLMYSYDPLNGLTEQESTMVIGGETHLWTELTDSSNLDVTIWPRAAAVAEVLWSGPKNPNTGENRSQIEASPRLAEFRERLVSRGVSAGVVQMPFCTQGNGSTCSLRSLGGGGSTLNPIAGFNDTIQANLPTNSSSVAAIGLPGPQIGAGGAGGAAAFAGGGGGGGAGVGI
ncbi:MAG: N-acetyl-glucosamine-6-phosphate deacetylase [Vezdaea aestivalis]|nr:MAG: N-acetyl-glucosamine-6-phosphate deacetylase [Vezdaea aestivalis]